MGFRIRLLGKRPGRGVLLENCGGLGAAAGIGTVPEDGSFIPSRLGRQAIVKHYSKKTSLKKTSLKKITTLPNFKRTVTSKLY